MIKIKKMILVLLTATVLFTGSLLGTNQRAYSVYFDEPVFADYEFQLIEMNPQVPKDKKRCA